MCKPLTWDKEFLSLLKFRMDSVKRPFHTEKCSLPFRLENFYKTGTTNPLEGTKLEMSLTQVCFCNYHSASQAPSFTFVLFS